VSVTEKDASGKAGAKPAMTVDSIESPVASAREVQTNAPRYTVDRIIRIVMALVAAIAFAALVWYFARLVTYLVVGIVLAYSLRPIADRIEGLGVGRITSIFSAFVVFMGLLSLLATYLVPFVASQVRELSQLVSVEEVSTIAATFEDRIARIFPIQEGAVISGVTRVFQTLFQEEGISSVMATLVGLFTNIFYAIIIIPFISFFFLKDGARIRQGIVRFVPNRFYEITLTIIEKVETNIGRYLKGLVVQCLSIATVASILLYIVGLDYALAVGIFAGLANTIPYFGPLMGFLAGVVVGVVQTGDFSLFLGVLVAMFVTQLADNVFFQPFIFSRVAEAHPLIILFVVLIGAQLGGIVGMLLAIPVTTTLRVVVQQVVWSARNYQVLKTT
jgi:predicted PurR-regulated permease PerM